MTDLEITRLCAEAMEFTEYHHATDKLAWTSYNEVVGDYAPLHDDAQAMALVKKLGLSISGPQTYERSDALWIVYKGGNPQEECTFKASFRNDINRAICECVAKMRLVESKNREPSPDFDTMGG